MLNLKLLVSIVLLLSINFLALEASQEKTGQGKYHDYASLTQSLKGFAASYPSLAKMQSIGKTLQGRELWMMQISGKGDPLEKQALLIAANLEGDHLIGSEVALGIAGYLLEGYGKEDAVTSTLDSRTIYIIPRLNPDGAEVYFNDLSYEQVGNLNPRDADYDWLVDEDGPDDLNGDGMITMMRVKDKKGDWIVDEEDPRLMKKKEEDTPVDMIYKLYTEGNDDDGDELYNEDGPGGYNINRNFPHNFGYKPKGLKVYAASEIETQALIDFMTRYDPKLKTQPHKNICGVLIFSKYDNLAAGTGIESGTPSFPVPSRPASPTPGAGTMIFRMGRQRGAQTAPQPRPTDPQPKRSEIRDAPLFKAVSEKYKEITQITSANSEKPYGSFLEYAYFQFGVPAFSANLWSLRKEPPAQEPVPKRSRSTNEDPLLQTGQTTTSRPQSSDRSAMMQRMLSRARGTSQGSSETSGSDSKWLKWIDDKNGGKGFVNWTRYDHKQLGEVEIGGFAPYIKTNPPADRIPELIKSHSDFALYLASQFAEIMLGEPEIERLSSNLFRITLKVHNNGKFPYSTAMGTRSRNITPIVLKLEFQDDIKMKLFGGSKRIDISTLGAGAENEYKWMIISHPNKKIDISLWARNGGGMSTKTIVLK
jgi:hypothetical protein